MKRSYERDVDRKARRIFDLWYFHSVDFFPLLLGNQVDLADTLPVLRALQNGFQTGKAAARLWPVAEHLPADPPRKDATDDEGYAVAYTEFVDLVAGRFVVGGEDDHVCGGD